MSDRLSALRGEAPIEEAPKKKKFFSRKEKKKKNKFSNELHTFQNLTEREIIEKAENFDVPVVANGEVREKDKRENLPRKERKRLNKKPETAFFVEMFFSNGTSREFVVSTPEEVFRYRKRWYYLRFENSWFNLTQNQYKLNYFDFALLLFQPSTYTMSSFLEVLYRLLLHLPLFFYPYIFNNFVFGFTKYC